MPVEVFNLIRKFLFRAATRKNQGREMGKLNLSAPSRGSVPALFQGLEKTDKRIMGTVRDLSDMLEVPMILVGMGKIRNNLTRFLTLACEAGSRPAALVRLRGRPTFCQQVYVDD